MKLFDDNYFFIKARKRSKNLSVILENIEKKHRQMKNLKFTQSLSLINVYLVSCKFFETFKTVSKLMKKEENEVY